MVSGNLFLGPFPSLPSRNSPSRPSSPYPPFPMAPPACLIRGPDKPSTVSDQSMLRILRPALRIIRTKTKQRSCACGLSVVSASLNLLSAVLLRDVARTQSHSAVMYHAPPIARAPLHSDNPLSFPLTSQARWIVGTCSVLHAHRQDLGNG